MMLLPRSALAVAALAAVLASASAARAQPDADRERQAAEALARPMTPAGVVLLLPHVWHAGVVDRLAQLLASPDADVRAVAARLAFVTGRPALQAPLAAALERETSTPAGAEMVRALALIAGPSADPLALRAIARFQGPAAQGWLDVVGRTRPADALPHLPALGAASGRVLAALAASDADAVARAFATLPSTPDLRPAYAAAIDAASTERAALPWPILAAGMSADDALKRLVVRDVLRRQWWGGPVPPEAVAAVTAYAASQTPDGDPYVVLAAELQRRHADPKATRTDLTGPISRLVPEDVPSGAWRDGWLRELSGAELARLRARVGDAIPPAALWEREPRPGGAPARGQPVGRGAGRTRTVRPLTPTLVKELAQLTGCRGGRDHVLAVEVAYRPTGQVREVFAPVGTGADRCGYAARLLAALDVASGTERVPPDRTDVLIVGFRPDDLACPRVEVSAVPAPGRTGGRLRPPKKVRNVQPFYPPELVEKGAAGVVVVEALIATTGCVAEAEVLRSVERTLDASAVAAVSAWRYQPAILDGTVVPVLMTISVNFAIER